MPPGSPCMIMITTCQSYLRQSKISTIIIIHWLDFSLVKIRIFSPPSPLSLSLFTEGKQFIFIPLAGRGGVNCWWEVCVCITYQLFPSKLYYSVVPRWCVWLFGIKGSSVDHLGNWWHVVWQDISTRVDEG